MKLHSSAIWIAVLCLSPVNIQKFIPERLSISIVSGTPLCPKNKVKIRSSSQKRISTNALQESWILLQMEVKHYTHAKIVIKIPFQQIWGIIISTYLEAWGILTNSKLKLNLLWLQWQIFVITWRRSSIALTPRISRSCSNLWQASATFHYIINRRP